MSRGVARCLTRILCTRHPRVPVAEDAAGISLPCPNVQLVMRRQPQAVGRARVVEELATQYRRRGVCGIPLLCVDEARTPSISLSVSVHANVARSKWCRNLPFLQIRSAKMHLICGRPVRPSAGARPSFTGLCQPISGTPPGSLLTTEIPTPISKGAQARGSDL